MTGYVLSKLTCILPSMTRLYISMIWIMSPITFMYFLNLIMNKYHGSFFCGIDIHDWIVLLLDLWCVQLEFMFQSTFLYWFGKIHTLILKFTIFTRIHTYALLVGLRPVIQNLCHVLARGWGRWLRYFTEAKAEVKYHASGRIRGPKHDTRFEWPVSILIMTWHPFLPFKTHKTSAKNPRLLTIIGAISFCRYLQCTPSQLWMHAPVAKERWLMTSQYLIFDRTDNLNVSCQRMILWIIRTPIMHID